MCPAPRSVPLKTRLLFTSTRDIRCRGASLGERPVGTSGTCLVERCDSQWREGSQVRRVTSDTSTGLPASSVVPPSPTVTVQGRVGGPTLCPGEPVVMPSDSGSAQGRGAGDVEHGSDERTWKILSLHTPLLSDTGTILAGVYDGWGGIRFRPEPLGGRVEGWLRPVL